MNKSYLISFSHTFQSAGLPGMAIDRTIILSLLLFCLFFGLPNSNLWSQAFLHLQISCVRKPRRATLVTEKEK